MLLVKTKISQSKIHGIGLFADELIPKGTRIWQFEPGFDIEVDAKKFKQLPKTAQAKLINSDYNDGSIHVLLGDDARFVNHSDNPNTDGVLSPDGHGYTIANRDILPGEEITTDYYDTDEDAVLKLGH